MGAIGFVPIFFYFISFGFCGVELYNIDVS